MRGQVLLRPFLFDPTVYTRAAAEREISRPFLSRETARKTCLASRRGFFSPPWRSLTVIFCFLPCVAVVAWVLRRHYTLPRLISTTFFKDKSRGARKRTSSSSSIILLSCPRRTPLYALYGVRLGVRAVSCQQQPLSGVFFIFSPHKLIEPTDPRPSLLYSA